MSAVATQAPKRKPGAWHWGLVLLLILFLVVILTVEPPLPPDEARAATIYTVALPHLPTARPADVPARPSPEVLYAKLHDTPLGLYQDREMCKAYALAAANYPSTVDFQSVMTGTQRFVPGGRAYAVDFSARNGFGLELTHRITCFWDMQNQFSAHIDQ